MTAEARGAAPAVVLEGVSKSFGNGLAVDGVTFSVAGGTCFGLLGPNGAGKSTTLKLLYGSLAPTRGRVRVGGIDLGERPRDAKRLLGVVPQDDTLDPDLTVGENLAFHARYLGLAGRAARAATDQALERMGLGDRARAGLGELSSGLRRRVVLARALLGRPSVVVLDEPTRGLDQESRWQYLAELGALKASGVTLVLATHELDEAEALCDRAAVMVAGRLQEVGRAAEVFRSARAGLVAVPGRAAC